MQYVSSEKFVRNGVSETPIRWDYNFSMAFMFTVAAGVERIHGREPIWGKFCIDTSTNEANICTTLYLNYYLPHHNASHLIFSISENIYKITKRLGPHLGPLLGAAAATGMGIVGIGIVHSPMSPFPVPSLPLPPVGQQPVGQVLYYPGYKDKVPKGKTEQKPASKIC